MVIAQEITQVIRGTITDRETHQPLIGATVSIINDKIETGTVSDVNGNFRLNGVSVGRKSIKVTYIGYDALIYPDIIVTSGKEIVLQLSLVESVNKIQEVTINFDRKKDPTTTNNEMATVSSRSFNPDDTKKYAGSMGDPSRMASNFAGVISGNDSRNDIVVRGNSPNAMLWQMEGVNIPNPNHFGSTFNTGGPVSMLNANNLGKSDFFTGAFPAQYGNATGAAFDLMMREGNNEKKEFIGQVGFNGFELGAEGPLMKKNGGSFIFNYRYSTIGLMKALGANVGTGAAVPLYQDVNFKISLPLNKNNKVSLWGMGGMSSIDLLGKDVDTTDINFYGTRYENTKPRYRSGVVGLSFESKLNTKTWAKFTLAASHASSEYSVDSIASFIPTEVTYAKAKGDFSDNKYSAVLNLTHKYNSRVSLNAGFIHDISVIDYHNKIYYNGGTKDTDVVNTNETVQLSQAYTQLKCRLNVRLSMTAGIHAQYLAINNAIAVEPRVGMKYLVNEKLSLTAAYGLHNQMLPVYNYFVRNSAGKESNKDLKFIQSNHFVAGAEYLLGKQTKVKTEMYLQLIDQTPVQNYSSSYSALNDGASFNPSNKYDLISNGTGKNYGLEITIERYLNKGFYYLITTSFFQSKYKGSDGIERNSAFNTGHAANVLAGKEFKAGRNRIAYINIKLTSVGGRYLTPLDLTKSAAEGKAVYDLAKAYSEKMDAYFRTDMKIGIRKDFTKSSMEFAIDFQNITNHKNIFSQDYNKATNRIVYNYQQGFFPVPMFRFTF